MFRINPVLPGITHITDEMGVCFTLIQGRERAVLFDTGYGTEDVCAFVRTITEKPLKVLLSHGHHDHILGSRWFEKAFLCMEDMEEFSQRISLCQRQQVAGQAKQKGIKIPDDYLKAPIRNPIPVRFLEGSGVFESVSDDLGGLSIRVIHVPGHTPGSIVIYVPESGLLMTGDNWNPCTWMWFQTSLSAVKWRDNMKQLIRVLERDAEIRYVLCSHQPTIRNGKELKDYLDYMTDERITAAPAVDMGSEINTHQIVKDEWTLVFDKSKIIIE